MSGEGAKAVFLSYASQDAEAAKRIAETLRASGVEVWFDADGGLEHGDEWDAKIRKQVKECVLFIAVISANTQAREEGYFRIEWDLAAERARGIASGVAFILPVVIDGTKEPDALVPDRFRMVQWTKLPGGVVPPDVQARFVKLWSHRTGVLKEMSREQPPTPKATASQGGQKSEVREQANHSGKSNFKAYALAAFAVLVLGAVLYRALKPRRSPEEIAKLIASAQALGEQVAARAAPGSAESRPLLDQVWTLLNSAGLARAELTQADDLCQRAAKVDPNNPDVWAAWSQADTWAVYYQFDSSPERRTSAGEKAAHALKLAPQSYEARLAQACYLVRGATADAGMQFNGETLALKNAENLLRALLVEKPDEPRTLSALGILLRNVRREPESIKVFDRLAANPAFAAFALSEKGWVLLARGQYHAAAEAAANSIAIEPTWGNLGLQIMTCELWSGDFDLALRTLERMPASTLLENWGVIYAFDVYRFRREPEKALAVLRAVPRDWISMNGFFGPKSFLTGYAHAMAGRPAAAAVEWRTGLDLVEQHLKTAPNDAWLYYIKGELLAGLGELPAATKAFQLYREFKGQDVIYDPVPPAIFLGQGDEAITALEQGVEKSGPVFATAAWLRLNPDYDPLRKLPRFQALLARLDADPRFSPGAQAKDTGPASSPPADPKSVAVLAFANLSDDKDNEYFSDGISEELLNVLAKVPDLKVSARTSAFYFKGKQVPMAEIARQLGVAYVVEGSVRKQGDRVRITAQLIKAADGFHVWSDTFTRDLKDIFAVQDEIAGLIAQNLQLKMGIEQSEARRVVDPTVYQEYLIGRALVAAGSATGARDGIARFREAVRRDPTFTAAWLQIARTYVGLSRWGGLLSPAEWAEASGAMERAVALEPNSPDVWLALGWVRRTVDWNWRGAELAFREALRLRPTHAETLTSLGVMLANLGREEEAIAMARRAAELDPLNAGTQMDLLGIFYAYERYPEAERAGRRAIELSPGSQITHGWLALCLVGQRRFPEAEAEARLEPEPFARQGAQVMSAIKQGHTAEARASLEDYETKAGAVGGAGNSYAYLAIMWGQLGEQDKGMAAIQRTREIRDPSIAWARTAFFRTALGTHPRWPEFLRSIGLADDQLK